MAALFCCGSYVRFLRGAYSIRRTLSWKMRLMTRVRVAPRGLSRETSRLIHDVLFTSGRRRGSLVFESAIGDEFEFDEGVAVVEVKDELVVSVGSDVAADGHAGDSRDE